MGEGDTYEEALTNVKSAIAFHVEMFGEEVLEEEAPVLEAFVAEAKVGSNVQIPCGCPYQSSDKGYGTVGISRGARGESYSDGA